MSLNKEIEKDLMSTVNFVIVCEVFCDVCADEGPWFTWSLVPVVHVDPGPCGPWSLVHVVSMHLVVPVVHGPCGPFVPCGPAQDGPSHLCGPLST